MLSRLHGLRCECSLYRLARDLALGARVMCRLLARSCQCANRVTGGPLCALPTRHSPYLIARRTSIFVSLVLTEDEDLLFKTVFVSCNRNFRFYSRHLETDTKLITSYTERKLVGVYIIYKKQITTKALATGQQICVCDSFPNCQSTPSCNGRTNW